jgi:mono/diheme cytochrome c family protein
MTSSYDWCKRAAFVIAVVGFGTGVALATQEVAPANPAEKRSVLDGVYTDEQARRGEVQYGRTCEMCHGSDLSGNEVEEVPALVWDAFLTNWSGRTVKDFVDSISRSMPRDKPGSLSARAYTDVAAYILQANKFPSGSRELDRDPKVLEQILIERSKK